MVCLVVRDGRVLHSPSSSSIVQASEHSHTEVRALMSLSQMQEKSVDEQFVKFATAAVRHDCLIKAPDQQMSRWPAGRAAYSAIRHGGEHIGDG